MAMHILQLGPMPPPEGGVSRNMLAIREELIKRGHSCSVIATTKSSCIVNECDIYYPRSAAELLRLLRSIKFDLLHLHVGGDIGRRILGLAFASTFFAGKRSVLTIHSGAFPLTAAARSARKMSLTGLIFRRFGRVIAINDDLADVFKRYGVEAGNIREILPFSLGLPDQNVAVPADLEEFYAAHWPVLLSVGGLERDYDPIFQIEAMRDILGDFPEAGLMLVGEGSMRRKVESKVVESGYANSIRIAGNVEHAVTLLLIERADMLLRTTLFDGDAISVREALFLGTPVIATDNAMRPVGTHLIGIGDRRGLVEHVRKLAAAIPGRPDRRTRDDSNVKKVIDLYNELL